MTPRDIALTVFIATLVYVPAAALVMTTQGATLLFNPLWIVCAVVAGAAAAVALLVLQRR